MPLGNNTGMCIDLFSFQHNDITSEHDYRLNTSLKHEFMKAEGFALLVLHLL